MNGMITLKLYVIGNSFLSKRAIKNFESICAHPSIQGHCDFEIVDIGIPQAAKDKEKILATPLLIKKMPLPQRRIIGDLSNTENVVHLLMSD